jgi:pilus assembly protein CpaC
MAGGAFAEAPASGSAPATPAEAKAAAAVQSRTLVAPTTSSTWTDAAGAPELITVAINKSRVISTGKSFRLITVGNPEVADVVPLATNRFYLLGRKLGSTNVVIADANNRPIGIFDVVVGYDLDALQRAVREIAPDDVIEIRNSGNGVTLMGTVDSGTKAGQIATLADTFAPDHVNNLLLVKGSQQVMLSVRFAEVQRSALKDMGVNTDATIFGKNGKTKWNLSSGEGINPEAFASGGVAATGARYAFDAMIDALEQKGMVRTLAEPNIIALSGDTASFLAGGEFPIPIAQSSGLNASNANYAALSVDFKQFGVGLSFTPTVIGKDAVNLEMSSEVSTIDPSVSFQNGSITVPGLAVRRTKTTIELLDGQSFAIAGLLQDDLNTSVRGLPGLLSIPILGSLFRSENFKRQQSELVVIITVHLVRPTTADKLADPLQNSLPPSEADLFLKGKSVAKPDTVAAPAIP